MKCSHCPRTGFCQGEQVSRLCELRNPSHPDHRRHLAPVMGEDGYDVAPVHVHAVAIDQPTMSLATGLAIVMCPVRGYPIPCGCQVEQRYCGATFHVVVMDDCRVCIESNLHPSRTIS